MNNTELAKVIQDVLVSPDIKKQRTLSLKDWCGHLCSLVNLIPTVGGALAAEIQTMHDAVVRVRENEFFRKLTSFIYEIKDIDVEDRKNFIRDIEKSANDTAGNVIIGLIDRLDNINKQRILANIVKARTLNIITIDDFFRLSSMLERIPYVELKKLPLYLNDFYDQEGGSELLFSTGVLMQTVIDEEEGNKYKLSKLGAKLLRYGLEQDISIDLPKGTLVANMITAKDVEDTSVADDRQFDDRVKDIVDKHISEKEYNESDRAQFDYDCERGK